MRLIGIGLIVFALGVAVTFLKRRMIGWMDASGLGPPSGPDDRPPGAPWLPLGESPEEPADSDADQAGSQRVEASPFDDRTPRDEADRSPDAGPADVPGAAGEASPPERFEPPTLEMDLLRWSVLLQGATRCHVVRFRDLPVSTRAEILEQIGFTERQAPELCLIQPRLPVATRWLIRDAWFIRSER
jgi:hypothetical protein